MAEIPAPSAPALQEVTGLTRTFGAVVFLSCSSIPGPAPLGLPGELNGLRQCKALNGIFRGIIWVSPGIISISSICPCVKQGAPEQPSRAVPQLMGGCTSRLLLPDSGAPFAIAVSHLELGWCHSRCQGCHGPTVVAPSARAASLPAPSTLCPQPSALPGCHLCCFGSWHDGLLHPVFNSVLAGHKEPWLLLAAE